MMILVDIPIELALKMTTKDHPFDSGAVIILTIAINEFPVDSQLLASSSNQVQLCLLQT